MQGLITTSSYIREQMFRLFTARIEAKFEHNIINIREQMFYLLIARIKAMFDHNMISIREEMFSIFKRG